LSAAQLFGDELARMAVVELALGFVDVAAGAGQGFEVALARGDVTRSRVRGGASAPVV